METSRRGPSAAVVTSSFIPLWPGLTHRSLRCGGSRPATCSGAPCSPDFSEIPNSSVSVWWASLQRASSITASPAQPDSQTGAANANRQRSWLRRYEGSFEERSPPDPVQLRAPQPCLPSPGPKSGFFGLVVLAERPHLRWPPGSYFPVAPRSTALEPPPRRARTFRSFLLFLDPNNFFIHLKLEVINIYFSKEMGNILSIRPSLPEADSCRPVLECSAPQAPVRGSYIFVGMSKNPGFSGTGRCLWGTPCQQWSHGSEPPGPAARGGKCWTLDKYWMSRSLNLEATTAAQSPGN